MIGACLVVVPGLAGQETNGCLELTPFFAIEMRCRTQTRAVLVDRGREEVEVRRPRKGVIEYRRINLPALRHKAVRGGDDLLDIRTKALLEPVEPSMNYVVEAEHGQGGNVWCDGRMSADRISERPHRRAAPGCDCRSRQSNLFGTEVALQKVTHPQKVRLKILPCKARVG